MRKASRIVMCILTAFLFCGCQPSPNMADTENSQDAVNTNLIDNCETSTSSEQFVSTEEINNSTVIPKPEKSIEMKIIGENIEISINADVCAPQTNALYIYTYSGTDIDKVFTDKLLSEMFVDTSMPIEYNESNNRINFYSTEHANEYFTIESRYYKASLFGHKDMLCPYGSNVYGNSDEDILINYTSSEAVNKCICLCENIIYDKYTSLCVTPYGSEEGERYYNILLSPQIDGISVVSPKIECEINVSEKGIYEAELYNFTIERETPIPNILSLEESIELLQQNVDKVSVYPNPSFYNIYGYTVDEDGKLCKSEIKKIELAYILKISGNGVGQLIPAWTFIPGSSEYLDYSCAIAVDAISGEVLLI